MQKVVQESTYKKPTVSNLDLFNKIRVRTICQSREAYSCQDKYSESVIRGLQTSYFIVVLEYFLSLSPLINVGYVKNIYVVSFMGWQTDVGNLWYDWWAKLSGTMFRVKFDWPCLTWSYSICVYIGIVCSGCFELRLLVWPEKCLSIKFLKKYCF